MKLLYRTLLLLYPPEFRAQFGNEMLRVHDEAAQEHRAGFQVAEVLGLLGGAIRERQASVSLIPIVGGLASAALLQWIFYAGAFRLLSAADLAFQRATIPTSDPLAEPIIVSMYAVTTLLVLLPLFLLLPGRVRRPRL